MIILRNVGKIIAAGAIAILELFGFSNIQLRIRVLGVTL